MAPVTFSQQAPHVYPQVQGWRWGKEKEKKSIMGVSDRARTVGASGTLPETGPELNSCTA